MTLDLRGLALTLARARAVVGLVGLLLPGTFARVLAGRSDPGTRALARGMAGRDLVLGIGAITTVHEQTQDAEWVGMGAAADAVDAAAFLLTPRLPWRARVVGLVAAGAVAVGIAAARDLADRRAEATWATVPTPSPAPAATEGEAGAAPA